MSTIRHKCELCEYGSNKTYNIKRHKMLKHGGKKPKIEIKTEHLEEEKSQDMIEVEPIQTTVECMQCFAKFKAKKSLNRHIKSIHTDIIIKCEQCNFTTNRKDTLRIHFKRKHGNTNFICKKCVFTTNHQDNLNQHIRKIHTLKECGKCLFTSYKMGDFKKHQALHEPDDIGVESASEDMYRKTWDIKGFEDPLTTLTAYKLRIKNTIFEYILKNGGVQWYIGVVAKNNLYHDGELIQEMGPTFTGRVYFTDDNGHFEEYYERSSSQILRNLFESATHNNRWTIEKMVYIYIQIKNLPF